ncbi:uncharacterized protein [Parasteatoda tepidariorum]|uniref:uncharacterized protein n=1 Tax=Parasteatoda tepidariorum TaxID=114398 RepID=UPI00077F8C4B|nr:dnaJ-like protein MG200 [Parasteatoda tepidariorum]
MSVKFSLLCKTNFLLNRSILNISKPIAIGFADDKSSNDKTDLYDTLGLKSSATNAEIKKAYYDLTKKYHPDRNEGNTDASTKFREVAEAYEVLGNYGMRKRYDKGLPLSLVKKQTARSAIVEKELKYQKFYDSRGAQQKFEWQTNEKEDEKPSKKEVIFKSRQKMCEDELAKSSKMQGLVAVFICFIVFLTQVVYRRKQ